MNEFWIFFQQQIVAPFEFVIAVLLFVFGGKLVYSGLIDDLPWTPNNKSIVNRYTFIGAFLIGWGFHWFFSAIKLMFF